MTEPSSEGMPGLNNISRFEGPRAQQWSEYRTRYFSPRPDRGVRDESRNTAIRTLRRVAERNSDIAEILDGADLHDDESAGRVVDAVRTDRSLRRKLGGYFHEKLIKNFHEDIPPYGILLKNRDHPWSNTDVPVSYDHDFGRYRFADGREIQMQTTTYAALLALAMIDGTYDAVSGPIPNPHPNGGGDGQHRRAAMFALEYLTAPVESPSPVDPKEVENPFHELALIAKNRIDQLNLAGEAMMPNGDVMTFDALAREGAGWKLHFEASYDEPKIELLLAALQEAGVITNFSSWHSGQSGMMLSVDAGHFDKAQAVALLLEEAISTELWEPKDDDLKQYRSFANRVMGRFDVNQVDPEIRQDGLPTFGNTFRNPDEERQFREEESKRVDQLLRKRYGAFYSGETAVIQGDAKVLPLRQRWGVGQSIVRLFTGKGKSNRD